MVFVPTRGDLPARWSPDLPKVPAHIGGAKVPASNYIDEERYNLERRYVLAPSWQIVCRSEEIPNAGDYLTWSGQDENIVVVRRKDGGVSAFHNICQHRGARIANGAGCARRFKCPWHDWVYDTEGTVIGIPDREDFDPEHVDGLRAPVVEADEWGGWVFVVLSGPGVAPPLLDWLGPEIATDLGAYKMENMILREKLTWDVDVNWKVVVGAFNEFYHAQALHHIPAKDAKDGREGRMDVFERHAMMVVPFKGSLEPLREHGDHQRVAICHYTIFPTSVFNNNPEHIQLFRSVPTGPHTTRFETWELWYDDEGDQDYVDRTQKHWDHLKEVVQEDVDVWTDIAKNNKSQFYKENIYNDHECKITFFHQTIDRMIAEGLARDAGEA